MECIFCQIVKGQQEADVVFENDQIIVFKDINPKASVHLLIVPKKHIKSINELEEQDKDLIAQVILLAKEMAIKHKIAKSGYRLTFNVGRGGGQIVDHLHLHLMGGGEK